MSLRLNGSVLGKRNVPTATLATGAWNLRAQSLYRRDNIWPRRDPDAVAFAATSGATDIDAISDFVKGVKRLGLWSNMVCWPLRSSQNAGTGTTAYSLGGLGTFNGTLVNGPTWGADGITFDGSDDQINITASFGAQRSVMAVGKAANTNGQFKGMFAFDTQTAPGSGIGYSNDNFGVLSQDPNIQYGSLTITNFNSLGASSPGSGNGNSFVYANGTSIGNAASNSIATTNPRIGRFSNAFFFEGPISAAMASTALWTSAQHAALYNLYKQTLGTGLGLP
jgi:hypothetical protein